MFDISTEPMIIRRLQLSDNQAIEEHFLRLDAETRHSRFSGTMDDASMVAYAHGLVLGDNYIVGVFVYGTLRAIGEMRGLFHGWSQGKCVHIAFSVERDFRKVGLGSMLMQELIRVASHYGLRKLKMTFEKTNVAMSALARRHGAVVTSDIDGAEGVISLPLSVRNTRTRAFFGRAVGGFWRANSHAPTET